MIILIFTLIFFVSDFLVKKIAVNSLSYNVPQGFIGRVVYLRLVYNKGIAFGLFQNKTFIFTLFGCLFIILFIIWIYKTANTHTLSKKIFLSMILGGGLSNLYDRIFLGYVIDYIDLRWWPVFNLSDSFITIGCTLFIVSLFLDHFKCKNRYLPQSK